MYTIASYWRDSGELKSAQCQRKCVKFDTFYFMVRTKNLILNTLYLIPGTKNLILNTWYLIPGTKNRDA